MTSIITAARKTTGLGDILKDYVPQQLEEYKPVMVEGMNPRHTLLQKYEQYLEQWQHTMDFDYVKYCKSIDDALSPEQLQAFFGMTLAYEEHPRYKRVSGLFFSQLIQNSYEAGHTHFEFRMGSFPPLDFFCLGLAGTKERRLMLNVEGDVGEHFCGSSSYLDVTLQGSCGDFSAQDMNNSRMTIHGKVNNSIGMSSNKTVFRTSDQETFLALINCYDPAQGNTIRLIGRNGERTSLNQLKNVGTSTILSLVDVISHLRDSYEFIRYDVIEKGVDYLLENRTKKVKGEKRP